MNRQAVIDVIRKIFEYYGYSINSSDVSDLLAEKDSEHIFIKFDSAANLNNLKHFSNNVHRYGGKGVIILEFVDDKTRSLALDEGLTLWDRSELESWVGRAVLAGALEEQGGVLVKDKPVFPTAQGEASEQVKTELDKTIKILLRSVPINIGKSDAISIALEKIGKSTRQKLKFVPVWFYSYSFKTRKMFKTRTVDLASEGEGHIHALTGENSFIRYKDFQDNVFVPTQNYEIKQAVVSKKDALGKAIDAIIREHSKEIRLNEMIGDTIVFENKVFAPDPEDINLKMELLHIPVWEIRGKGETIEINGYDGHVVAIKAYSDAEFV